MREEINESVVPGEITKIGGKLAAIVNEHNEVYYYWQKSGFRNATLLHVDMHDDAYQNAEAASADDSSYYARLKNMLMMYSIACWKSLKRFTNETGYS